MPPEVAIPPEKSVAKVEDAPVKMGVAPIVSEPGRKPDEGKKPERKPSSDARRGDVYAEYDKQDSRVPVGEGRADGKPDAPKPVAEKPVAPKEEPKAEPKLSVESLQREVADMKAAQEKERAEFQRRIDEITAKRIEAEREAKQEKPNTIDKVSEDELHDWRINARQYLYGRDKLGVDPKADFRDLTPEEQKYLIKYNTAVEDEVTREISRRRSDKQNEGAKREAEIKARQDENWNATQKKYASVLLNEKGEFRVEDPRVIEMSKLWNDLSSREPYKSMPDLPEYVVMKILDKDRELAAKDEAKRANRLEHQLEKERAKTQLEAEVASKEAEEKKEKEPPIESSDDYVNERKKRQMRHALPRR